MKATVTGVAWPFDMTLDGLVGGELKFSFVCRSCGGWMMRLDDNEGDLRMASCTACGEWWGRLGAIKVRMALMAREAGYSVEDEMNRLLDQDRAWREAESVK